MQAANYAYGEPGELLFHYTRARTAFELILPNNTIRLNTYQAMRDPLDAQHWPDPTAFWVDQKIEDQDQRELGRIGVVVAAKSAARLLCLTADADDYEDDVEPFGRGYARASMWQFYADDHRGVCLAFDRERLLARLRHELADSYVCVSRSSSRACRPIRAACPRGRRGSGARRRRAASPRL